MKTTVIKLGDAPVSNWAGGRTHELYIHPKTASYKERNFGFRLSVATCELEESAYTHLPGVTRHLVMLEGNARVHHKGQGSVTMTPFNQVDVFDGGIESSAMGKVSDFNLMLSGGYQGELLVISNEQTINLEPKPHSYAAVYCHKGEAAVKIDDEALLLQGGTLLFAGELLGGCVIELSPKDECNLIFCHMYKE